MNKEQLLARSAELEIQVPEGATNTEISNLIKVAEHPIINGQLAKTQEALEVSNTKNNTLTVDLTAEKTKVQTGKEALKASEGVVELLRAELAEKAETTDDSEGAVYESGNKTYQFGVNAFRFKGDKYEASEAVKDKSLMADLIKSKFNLLKEI
ncbi:hypothetical protein FORMB_18960 [Formosa sp. Hel1_33_131]|uniref:hypothetical protein n=1 Tax=Formosa sp. Hel1_33_131 TaxID=1336794 RepID=UPI00084E36D0|nr:hypothetical protein [Formosa sp. Hel1_33_131]AOR28926.1 hypothetical protein FORMB_18960 [Formosa sp. Hel1_33_131]